MAQSKALGNVFKLRDIINVKDPAYGAKGDGVTDDTAVIQAAITANPGRTIFFPTGKYKLTNRITISKSVNIVGEGPIIKGNTQFLMTNLQTPPSAGAVFVVAFTAATASEVFLVQDSSNKMFTVSFENVEFFANYQPNPGVGWTPTTTPYAIRSLRSPFVDGIQGLTIRNVMLRNLTHGLKINSDAFMIDGLYDQCFVQTLFVDGCYDTCHVTNMHSAQYWSGDSHVSSYQQANHRFILLGRVDNPIFENVFCLLTLVGMTLQDSGVGISPAGTPSRVLLSNCGFDAVSSGIQSTVASPSTTEITLNNFYVSNDPSLAGGKGIDIAGTGDAFIIASNGDFSGSYDKAVELGAGASKCLLSNVRVRSYNQGNVGAPALGGGSANSRFYLSSVFVDTTQGNGAAATATSAIQGAINSAVRFPATAVVDSDANALGDYEKGTWTPIDGSGAGLTFTNPAGTYEKTDRQVVARFSLTYPVTASGATATIGGLPFTVANAQETRQGFVSNSSEATATNILPSANATTVLPGTLAGAGITNATMSADTFYATAIYHI